MTLPTWQPDQITPAQEEPPVSPVPSPPAVQKSKGADRSTIALLMVAALIAVGGVGFALGHVTAPTSAASVNARPSGLGGRDFASLAPGQTFNPAQFGAGRTAGSASVSGTVTSFDGTTLVIAEANGASVSIDVAGTTTYHTQTSATPSQVVAGASVTVQIATGASASGAPNPEASGARTLSAKDVLITTP